MWQTLPMNLSPYIFDVGFFRLHWYGLMYIVAFVVTLLLVLYRIKHEDFPFSKEVVLDYLIWAILGLLIGARLGYVLFYNPAYYLAHPLQIFLPFDFQNGLQLVGISGMSYHGGLIGIVTATIWFVKKKKLHLGKLIDLFVPAIPLGYLFGRIGNFINGELYGRITDMPWGMIFPGAPYGKLRHPSQLYEAFFEGLILFLVLWFLRKKKALHGHLLSLYLIGYGIARFAIEFVREPDAQLGFVIGTLTMGQLLTSIMIIVGIVLLATHKRIGYAKKN